MEVNAMAEILKVLLTGEYTRLVPTWNRREADAYVEAAIKLLTGMGYTHFRDNPKDTRNNKNILVSKKGDMYENGVHRVAMVRMFYAPRNESMHVDIQLS
jgi:hypothetical protein